MKYGLVTDAQEDFRRAGYGTDVALSTFARVEPWSDEEPRSNILVMEVTAMDEAAIRRKLGELNEAMTAVPSGGGKPKSGEGVYCSHTSTEAPSMENTLDYLRLHIKYLMFDLEATRRENRYLRQMIENRRRPNSDGHKGDANDF